MFAADLTYSNPFGTNTLDAGASARIVFGPTGGPYTPYGVGLTIPAGSTALLQVAGDLAGAPIPAGSEVMFEVDDVATLGVLSDFALAARLRTV